MKINEQEFNAKINSYIEKGSKNVRGVYWKKINNLICNFKDIRLTQSQRDSLLDAIFIKGMRQQDKELLDNIISDRNKIQYIELKKVSSEEVDRLLADAQYHNFQSLNKLQSVSWSSTYKFNQCQISLLMKLRNRSNPESVNNIYDEILPEPFDPVSDFKTQRETRIGKICNPNEFDAAVNAVLHGELDPLKTLVNNPDFLIYGSLKDYESIIKDFAKKYPASIGQCEMLLAVFKLAKSDEDSKIEAISLFKSAANRGHPFAILHCMMNYPDYECDIKQLAESVNYGFLFVSQDEKWKRIFKFLTKEYEREAHMCIQFMSPASKFESYIYLANETKDKQFALSLYKSALNQLKILENESYQKRNFWSFLQDDEVSKIISQKDAVVANIQKLEK